MDKVRLALIAALATITLMLVIEYQRFTDEHNKQNLLAQTAQQQKTQRANNDVPAASTIADSDSEVPQLIDTQEAPAKPVSTEAIVVDTDKFTVTIDPYGGDITQVKLKQHLARIDTPDIPFVILEQNKRRTYIAKSGLVGPNGTDLSSKTRPLFRVDQLQYAMAEDKDSLQVDFFYQDKQGNDITKRFTFKRDSYLIDVDYLIKNNSATPWKGRFYALLKRDSTIDPSSESGTGGMGMQPYLGFAVNTKEEKFRKIDFDDIKEENFKESVNGGWIAMVQHYFLSAWIGNEGEEYEYSTFVAGDRTNIARMTANYNTEIASGAEGNIHAALYVGPKDQYTLEAISEGLDLSVDYGFLWMIAQPLYALLYFINNGELHAFGMEMDVFGGVGNWGFSIILLTILVKILFFGLNKKAYTSMAKMRAIQPKMLAIRDRYADDRQKQSQEMMALYSKEGVNPVGGCLPMIVQMPVFIALYWVLLESVELRHAPFIGYIKDLSAMDPYFIMPLVMGASMWFQQKLNPPPPDPMQAKVMQFLPVIFTFFFLFFPAGLVLYWVVNNILSIAQQWYITKHIIGDAEK